MSFRERDLSAKQRALCAAWCRSPFATLTDLARSVGLRNGPRSFNEKVRGFLTRMTAPLAAHLERAPGRSGSEVLEAEVLASGGSVLTGGGASAERGALAGGASVTGAMSEVVSGPGGLSSREELLDLVRDRVRRWDRIIENAERAGNVGAMGSSLREQLVAIRELSKMLGFDRPEEEEPEEVRFFVGLRRDETLDDFLAAEPEYEVVEE